MQKAIRLNLLARNQTVKRAHLKQVKQTKEEWDQYQKGKVIQQRAERDYVKAERKNRRDDWIQGPLAPKRDVGDKKAAYGSVGISFAQNPTLPKIARSSPKEKGSDALREDEGWEGEGIVGNVAVNDRVVVVHGRDELIGKIGVVKSVSLEKEEVTLQGMNMADVELPSWQPQPNKNNPQYFISMELPIPMSSVRLVYHLEDSEAGFNRDVVVRHLRGGAPYIRRPHGSNLPSHTRYIAGEDIELPWPEEDERQTFTAEDVDTPRLDVEKDTYEPDLYSPPLPVPSILDELRPKYRRDRTRHDDNKWIVKKVQEDARSIWWMNRKILTPQQEKAEADVKERKAFEESQGRGVLTEQSLELIDEMQKMTLGQAGYKKLKTQHAQTVLKQLV